MQLCWRYSPLAVICKDHGPQGILAFLNTLSRSGNGAALRQVGMFCLVQASGKLFTKRLTKVEEVTHYDQVAFYTDTRKSMKVLALFLFSLTNSNQFRRNCYASTASQAWRLSSPTSPCSPTNRCPTWATRSGRFASVENEEQPSVLEDLTTTCPEANGM